MKHLLDLETKPDWFSESKNKKMFLYGDILVRMEKNGSGGNERFSYMRFPLGHNISVHLLGTLHTLH